MEYLSNSDFNWHDEKEKLIEIFDFISVKLISYITNLITHPMEKKYIEKWITTLIDYNNQGGKFIRGLIVICTFKTLKPSASPEEIFKAQILGIAIELLQTSFLVADDIMDRSEMRRGKQCWYSLPDIGLKAINDCYIIESCVYMVLKEYIRDEPTYVNIIELFHEISLRTELGQILDMSTEKKLIDNDLDINLDLYTMDRVYAIAENKTAYYTFYLPVACAMYLSRNEDKFSFFSVREICTDLGIFFQAQDDFLDCFGDENTIGKIGTDIQTGKCSWLVATALKYADTEQTLAIKKNYGRDEISSANIIKKIFKDLDLPTKFKKYEEDSYRLLYKKINNIECLPSKIFFMIIDKVYKRLY